MTDEELVERLYNVKLSKYIKQGVEVSDELDAVLYEEAMREVAMSNYINERGRLSGRRKG